MSINNNLRLQIENFCKKIGTNKSLVYGAGGNISWKESGLLWIKSSGTNLADATKKNIFVPIQLKILKKNIKNNLFYKKIEIAKKEANKPSIETYMHAVIPHRIVVHLHPVDFLVRLINKNSELILKKLLSGYIVDFFEYIKPGGKLAKKIYNRKIKFKKINIILLQNHGFVVSSNNLKPINLFLKKILKKIKIKKKFYLKRIDFKAKKILGYKFSRNKKIQNIIENKNIFNNLTKNWAICPDHVNFLGSKPLIFSKTKDYISIKNKKKPPFLFFKKDGVYEKNFIKRNEREQLVAYYDIVSKSNSNLITTLNKSQINEIINWKQEIYRRNL
jgi:rhamnose utilization protein RhaD (predicted bifunctional aldolase and dehydrogenase)